VPSRNRETSGVNPEWARRHHAFHHSLISAAQNRWLLRFWSILYDQGDRYRWLAAGAARPDGLVSTASSWTRRLRGTSTGSWP
jgi:DNA-binding GntR family transcriptional regulator